MARSTHLALLALLAGGAAACTDGSTTDKSDTDTDTDTMDTDTDTMTTSFCDIPGITCDESQNLARLVGTITESFRMTPDWNWSLEGGVFIDGNSTLTIDPGTTIYGDNATDGFLVIERGSKIMAEGSATDPIVFTSSLLDGSRGRSDWGGLVINGMAKTNSCTDFANCDVPGEAGTGTYGGDDDGDDSGVLKYVRVEFAGTLVNDQNELNGIAFQAVGSGTEVDFVHAHRCADDGMEFFGGTVEAKHLIITGTGDDGLDWTDGWRGKVQYAVVQHFADDGDNGIEADNNGDDNTATPMSMPKLSNITVVGTSGNDLGMLLREGTGAILEKVAVMGYGDACGALDQELTYGNLGTDLTIEDSFYNCPSAASSFVDVCLGEDTVAAWCTALSTTADVFFSGGMTEGDLMLTSVAETSPNWTPAAGSPLLGVSGGISGDSFFDTTNFAGAADSGDAWWSWTEFAAN
ncbi:MAG: hypothetical protein H6733_00135 [Alphaproteobacteria bacterium]|nr:hypothetical protein [Alphaproteobacteria bacterium]